MYGIVKTQNRMRFEVAAYKSLKKDMGEKKILYKREGKIKIARLRIKIWKVKAYLFLFIDSYHMNYKEEKGHRNGTWVDVCMLWLRINNVLTYYG